MTKKQKTSPSWGPVLVNSPYHEGRIGYYDDDDYNFDKECEEAIIYFGDPQLTGEYYILPLKDISEVTTQSLVKRRGILRDLLSSFKQSSLKGENRARALQELNYVEAVLSDRIFSARLTETQTGASVFISHSSKDNQFAHWLAVDLKHAGHKVWFDEWKIRVGQSIPREIGHGLENCEFVAVVLSSHAVNSHWVENEWHAKY